MIAVYTLDLGLATRTCCDALGLKALVCAAVQCFDLPLYSRVEDDLQPRVS